MMPKWSVECGEWGTLAEQRAAAYDLLCRLMDGERPRLEHDDKGAPYLSDHPDLYVSISHCRRAVAAAVSAASRVGIDVECRRRVDDSLIERVCTADEKESIRLSDDPTMTFLQLWTRKEAVLKQRGTGIQGFGSMVDALVDSNIIVKDLETGNSDTVAALAVPSRT